jgi:glucose-6-phosphate isomerase
VSQESSPAGAGRAWNTVAGDGFELFFGYRDEAAFAAQVEHLVAERFASRLGARDHTLWGVAAEEESAKRLGWVDLSATSQPLVEVITALRDELHGAGLTRVVLCGMGGSSLAPEVICGAAGVDLDVLDSSDPDFVRSAL